MDLYNYGKSVIKKLPDFLNDTVEHQLKQTSQKGLYTRLKLESMESLNVNLKFKPN